MLWRAGRLKFQPRNLLDLRDRFDLFKQLIRHSRIKRHQMVYQALGDKMRAEIHALSMKTLTPAEWAVSPDNASLQHH